MDRLSAIEAFVGVAETASFSAAARKLGTSKSAISRHVSALEMRLGARLFHRTTRALTLTEAGHGYLDRAQRLLADLEEADRAVGQLQAAPRGRLRINAPMSFGFLHLAPAIPDFLARHREVDIDLVMNDRFVDLVDEGFDVAVRIGTLANSSLIARRLAPIRRVVCASPEYLRQRGFPKTPDDLKAHICLPNTNISRLHEWRFQTPDGKSWPVEIRGRLSANNGDALRVAALKGLGLTFLPTFIAGADLKTGALVPVLEAFVPQDMTLNAVYPHARHLSPKVRAFVDFLIQRFGPEPYWDSGD